MNVELARIQFAFTSINHFFFVPVTIGLAFLTALLLAVLAVIAAVWLVYEHRDGWAFTATTITIAACIGSIFVDLYRNVMVSSTSPAYNLTVHNTASGAYSLKAMTVVVIIFLPLVLGYQVWTYYVFRQRVSRQEFLPAPQPSTPPGAGHPTGAPEATSPLSRHGP